MLGKKDEQTLYEGDTAVQHYQVVDMVYDHRPARVLFSGKAVAAQSGVARDDDPDLLFDYNQRFLEILSSVYPERVLVIGGGAFTLPMALLGSLPDVKVDVFELDEGLLPIAKKYFGLAYDDRLRVYFGEGRALLEKSQQKYDAIILDAFDHVKVPESLATLEAAQEIKNHLNKNGLVAINIISAYFGERGRIMRQQYAAYSHTFKHITVFPAIRSLLSFWLPQNFVLVAENGKAHDLQVRYEPMEPLQVDKADAKRDAK